MFSLSGNFGGDSHRLLGRKFKRRIWGGTDTWRQTVNVDGLSLLRAGVAKIYNYIGPKALDLPWASPQPLKFSVFLTF